MSISGRESKMAFEITTGKVETPMPMPILFWLELTEAGYVKLMACKKGEEHYHACIMMVHGDGEIILRGRIPSFMGIKVLPGDGFVPKVKKDADARVGDEYHDTAHTGDGREGDREGEAEGEAEKAETVVAKLKRKRKGPEA
jgi:hypothetical protein